MVRPIKKKNPKKPFPTIIVRTILFKYIFDTEKNVLVDNRGYEMRYKASIL